MFRTITYLAAAAILTTGAVAALAQEPDAPAYKVTVRKSGDYCVHTPAMTGSRLDKVECHSTQEWAKEGVTFQKQR